MVPQEPFHESRIDAWLERTLALCAFGDLVTEEAVVVTVRQRRRRWLGRRVLCSVVAAQSAVHKAARAARRPEGAACSKAKAAELRWQRGVTRNCGRGPGS